MGTLYIDNITALFRCSTLPSPTSPPPSLHFGRLRKEYLVRSMQPTMSGRIAKPYKRRDSRVHVSLSVRYAR